jgi:hypothetical protein
MGGRSSEFQVLNDLIQSISAGSEGTPPSPMAETYLRVFLGALRSPYCPFETANPSDLAHMSRLGEILCGR